MLPGEIRSVKAVLQDSVRYSGSQYSGQKKISKIYHHEPRYCKIKSSLFSLAESIPKENMLAFYKYSKKVKHKTYLTCR